MDCFWYLLVRTRPQTSQKITQKELEQHSTTSSLWLSIGGVVSWVAALVHRSAIALEVCDVTDFLMLHPGGNQVGPKVFKASKVPKKHKNKKRGAVAIRRPRGVGSF